MAIQGDSGGGSYSTNRIADIIDDEANRYGVPTWIARDIAKVESSLNPATVGDGGTSFGLFQLHRGGLAPDALSDTQLLDPRTNAHIAMKSLAPAVKRGIASGYDGYQLLEYSAFTSAWPGNYGSIAAGERARPDYARALARAYGEDPAAISKGAIDGTNIDNVYGSNAFHSTSAEVFRQMAHHEHIQKYSDWKQGKDWQEKINPFAYVGDQGTAFGIRVLLVLIGLVFVIVAVVGLVLKEEAKAAPAVEGMAAEGAVV